MQEQKFTRHLISQSNGTSIINHSLHETKIFEDENLARAIENHPSHLLDICLKGSFIQVDRNGASGKEILDCVKKGILWINLRRIETIEGPIGSLIRQLHQECNKLLRRPIITLGAY